MAFRPLKDDAELEGIISELSRTSESCAVLTTMFNRAKDAETRLSAKKRVEEANKKRKQIKQKLKALVNERISSAYTAGLQDSALEQERRANRD